MFPYRRILIYGVTGSGKSTLARNLAEALGRTWISVDDLTWLPGWKEVDSESQRALFNEICAQDDWILDTAYGKWLDVPLERVELVIALDYSRACSFGRLLRRTLHRVVTGVPVCNGNRESLRQQFSKNSILQWHFVTFARKRQRIRSWQQGPRSFDIVTFQSPTQTERWLRLLEQSSDLGHVEAKTPTSANKIRQDT